MSGKLQLSFITGRNERVEPLVRGEVPIEGIEIVPTISDPSETFWRQLRFEEFDIAEMSLSSYLIAKAQGADMVGIPVFPARRFMHTELWVHVDAGIDTAADIGGKRLGVAEYQQTSSLWTRGVLEHDFEVSQFEVDWYMERSDTFSHGGATGFQPPEGIRFSRIPEEETLDSMLLAHRLDVAVAGRTHRHLKNVVDRATMRKPALGDWSRVRPLFPDKIAEGVRFFRQHGFIPANHLYVIRGELSRRHPWIAFNLYKAFLAAKDLATEALPRSIPSALIFGEEYLEKTRSWFGNDPYPYGVRENRNMLDMAVNFSVEQGLVPRRLTLEELFARSTLDL